MILHFECLCPLWVQHSLLLTLLWSPPLEMDAWCCWKPGWWKRSMRARQPKQWAQRGSSVWVMPFTVFTVFIKLYISAALGHSFLVDYRWLLPELGSMLRCLKWQDHIWNGIETDMLCHSSARKIWCETDPCVRIGLISSKWSSYFKCSICLYSWSLFFHYNCRINIIWFNCRDFLTLT